MAHERLAGFLSYVGLLLLIPLTMALLIGFLGHSATLGIKTFLLIELGMAVLSPLLNAVIASGQTRAPHRRGK